MKEVTEDELLELLSMQSVSKEVIDEDEIEDVMEEFDIETREEAIEFIKRSIDDYDYYDGYDTDEEVVLTSEVEVDVESELELVTTENIRFYRTKLNQPLEKQNEPA